MQEKIFIISLMQWCLIIMPLASITIALGILVILFQYWQAQEQKIVLAKIKIGSPVSTVSGQRGTVCALAHNVIIIELACGRKIEILRQTVAAVHHE